MMIKERYVSFETSKLLKKKGFNEHSFGSYDMRGQSQEGYAFWNKTEIYYAAPTLYMTMEWLREKGIEIEIKVDFDCMSEPPTYAFVGYSAKIYTIEKAINVDEIHIDRYETYEAAVEAAILYSLEKLI